MRINLNEDPAYFALKRWAAGDLKFAPKAPEDQQTAELVNELIKIKAEQLLQEYENDIVSIELDGEDITQIVKDEEEIWRK